MAKFQVFAKEIALKRRYRLLGFLGVVLLAIGAFVLWVMWPTAKPPGPTSSDPAYEAAPPIAQHLPSNDPPSRTLAGGPVNCDGLAPPGAASANGAALRDLVWTPFGREERGWETYAPSIAAEIGVACPYDSRGFAGALARWQLRHRLPPTGEVDQVTFTTMLNGWNLARPFVRVNARGICPNAPALADLSALSPAESYGGKLIQLRPGALDAYRRLREAARRDGVITASAPGVLSVISGFRDPDADAARCARDNNCQGLVRSICSAHRTGLAVDLFLPSAPGHGPIDSADENRLYQSRSPAFGWMVVNARRFGFVNYPFEPWHWEWTGEAPLPGVPISSLPQAGSAPVEAPAPAPAPRPALWP